MKLRLIEAYKAMIECGTVSAAARAVGISQPAMTNLLTQLQDELKLVLFERQGGRLIPTAEAMALKGSMDRAWDAVIDLKEFSKDVRDLQRGRLTVAAFPGFAQALLPIFVVQFAREATKATIVLHSRPSRQVIDWTADGQCDLGIAAVAAPRSGVHLEPLGKMATVCVLPIGHRLAARKVIRAQDLRGEAFISLADVDHSRSRVDAVFKPDGIERDIRLSTPHSGVALALVANGGGVSIIDEATAALADKTRVAIRPFVPAVSFDMYLYHPANRVPSELQERFVRAFREWFKGRPSPRS